MTEGSGSLGIFDSGVGGLTVVRALLERFPNQRVLYVADQAHVPYGGRPLDEVRGYAAGISDFLAGAGCRAIVMACNISSATALCPVRRRLAPLPVLGVITAAARRAALGCGCGPGPLRVGVLATEGTVRTGAYTRQINALNPTAEVHPVACPRFVPLVEAGMTEGAEAAAAAREYLAPLAQAGVHVVVLGCTHYPYLLPALRLAASDLFEVAPTFVDPAHEMADALAAAMPHVATTRARGPNVLLSTGDAAVLRAQAPQFLPGVDARFCTARWTPDGRLEQTGCR